MVNAKKHMEKTRFKMQPVQKIVLGFLAVMLIGGFLLALPISWSEGNQVSLIDAMFSSFSAVCVTGLASVEIGAVYSLFGQIVMLVLIQIGGLGYMTVTSVIFMTLGKRFSLRDRMAMQESLNEFKLQGVVRTTRNAVLLTGICECIGTALLAIRFIPAFGWAKGLFFSVFHAVSAFCNAGFDVFGKGTNFLPYIHDPLVLYTIMGLIVFGGLGFLVVIELSKWTASGFKTKLSLQAKIVLSATAFLILAGTLCVCLAEWNNPKTLGLGDLNAGEKIMNGMFQSITTRTAGFSSISQIDLRSTSAFVTVVLMFIGASPAGTGGGVKTTTGVIVLLLLLSITRGRDEVSIFRRRIDRQIVMKALAIVLIGLLFVAMMTLLIAVIEADRFETSRILFEVVSAFGTVGLSQSLTPLLSTASKIAIICCMYAGRVGLISIMTAITLRFNKEHGNIRYAEEKIMVG